MNDRPSLLVRLWRLRGGRNPLARRVDRAEFRLVLAAIALVLITIPFATAIGSDVTAQGLERSRHESATRTTVTAVTVADAPYVRTAAVGSAGANLPVDVAATWTTADGAERHGVIVVEQGTKAGAKTTIWLDGAGNPAAAPFQPADARVSGLATGIGIWLAVSALLIAVCGAAHLALNRRRYDQWGREWDRIGRDSSYS
ncbi:Rv1733c family protein [Amycolatopsis alkalitolerans]|uniref:Transmembrane protein n=1 Tax=Amycolatopsis alkalitolerans TaxID=2547244 RepID=A0A5C4M2A4_9PSEU|nr:hypothetical protein [Amycolatopsis alkalitolerans]TNC25782.1 hypothetical protein FG385_14145 [Amycolatopsis alkalitolerans]